MKCKNFIIHCGDSDFFETESINTTDYFVEKNALWCFRKNFIEKGGEIDERF